MGLTSGLSVPNNNEINKRTKEIPSRMNLGGKIGQMWQISIEAVCK